MNLLSLQNISFFYGRKNDNSYFLNDINLSIKKGEFVTILGPNGSGKTTILKLMSGTLKPQKGEVLFDGKKLNSFSKKETAKKIGFVPQVTMSVFPFSIYEIVLMGRTPYLGFGGFEDKNDKEKIEEALELVEISHLKNKGINEVSGGEAQRAFIARALVQEPEIILLDEPNAHLDIKHQISVFELFKKFNEEKDIAIVAVSHDLNLAGNYSGRVVLMQDGNIFSDGIGKNVLTSENIKTVFEVNAVTEIINDMVSVHIKTGVN